jgi:integrase
VPGAKLGQPIRLAAALRRLIVTVGVRKIKPHRLRHTNATGLLAAFVPVTEVARRLGDANVATTLGTYAHALPNMDQEAAAKLGAMLTDASQRS